MGGWVGGNERGLTSIWWEITALSSNVFTIWCRILISRSARVFRRFKRRSCFVGNSLWECYKFTNIVTQFTPSICTTHVSNYELHPVRFELPLIAFCLWMIKQHTLRQLMYKPNQSQLEDGWLYWTVEAIMSIIIQSVWLLTGQGPLLLTWDNFNPGPNK